MELTMLKDMSQDTLAHIIESLVNKEIIKPGQIDMALIGNPSNEVKRDVDLYHNLVCLHDHQSATDMQRLYCGYYIEEQEDECWILPAHTLWLSKLLQDKVEYQIDDIKRLAKGFREVEEALAKYPIGYQKIIKACIKFTVPVDKGQVSFAFHED